MANYLFSTFNKYANYSHSYFGAWQLTYAVFVIFHLFFSVLQPVPNLINGSCTVITLLQAWSPMWDII